MLKLEAGKRYWMRYGGVSGVLKPNDSKDNIFSDEFFTWTPEGSRFGDAREYDTDLVREYTEPQPQPLEWKRGIPTEEECRECWIITGGSGATPHGLGSSYLPGCFDSSSRSMLEAGWYLALNVKPVEPPKPKTKTITLQEFTHTSGDKRWMVVEEGEMAGCWTATSKTKTVEVSCE